MILGVLVSAFGIRLSCLLVDWLRLGLFSALLVRDRLGALDAWATPKVQRLLGL